MSVYNGQRYLREAVDSILAQTFRDFELIVFDDKSTDGSLSTLRSYRDERIRVVANDENRGLTANLNSGLQLARGEFIARQDADDLSLPSRLAEQVAFLDRRPDVAVVGSTAAAIDDGGRDLRLIEVPCGVERIRQQLFRQNCVVHGSVVFRKEPIVGLGGYCENYRYAQDYDLWLRVTENFGIENLPRVLVKYRYHAQQVSAGKLAAQFRFADLARRAAFRRRGIVDRRRFLRELLGCEGTLGRQYFGMADALAAAGNRAAARKLRVLSFLRSPLNVELVKPWLPAYISRRLQWYRNALDEINLQAPHGIKG